MQTDNFFKSLLKYIFFVFLVIFGLICIDNLFIKKSSIFNYFRKKNESYSLEKKLEKKLEERKNLLNDVNILSNKSTIDLDMLEKETIKKLNKIPQGYKILTE